MSNTHSSLKRLRNETEGAVLVVGIMMGVLMVGALWNVVSIGDAILWRERLQDAADAAAFETAVWNARGMNVISFLNIVMAAAMSILVALRGVIMVTSAVLAAMYAATLACGAAWLPIGVTQALCAIALFGPRFVQPAQQWALRMEPRANSKVMPFIERVRKAQEVVATITPLIGVKESIQRTSAEYQMNGVGLSPSLLPRSHRAGARVAPGDREAMARIGRVVSLPVSWEGEWKLCLKAGEFVPNELIALLNEAGIEGWLLNEAGGFIRNLAGSISGSLPSVFCGDRSPQDIAALNDMFRDTAQNSCRAARERGRVTSEHADHDRYQDFQQYWERRSPIIVGPDGEADAHAFNTESCERDQIEKQNREYRAERGAKAARVWRYAVNGDFFMQAWGIVEHPPSHLAGNDRGLAFADGGSRRSVLDLPYENPGQGTAQAEMYRDCAGGAWAVCDADAMWMMRWKARLRRLHNPVEMAQRSLAQIAMAELINAMHRVLVRVAANIEGRAGAFLGQREQGFGARAANFLRGNLWDTAYLNRGTVGPWDPLGWVAEQTVGRALAADPPAPNELIIH